MTLTEMLTEIYARGFDYWAQDSAGVTRATRYINNARAELDRMFLWPWRQKSTSGAAPLAIADLGPVQSVVDSNELTLSKIDAYGDLTTTGSPSGYYVTWTSGTPTVAVYPVSTDSITVNYWRVTPDLSAGSDTPVSPSEAHYLIVDLAVRRALMDSDNPEAGAAVQGEVDRQMDALLMQYPPGVVDGPDFLVGVTGASEDW